MPVISVAGRSNFSSGRGPYMAAKIGSGRAICPCGGFCAVETQPARKTGTRRAAMRTRFDKDAHWDKKEDIVATHRFFVLRSATDQRERLLLRAGRWPDRECPMAELWRSLHVASGTHFVANLWHINSARW